MEVKRYYMSLYRASMVKMYDMGYISDPTRYDEKELRCNVKDMNIQWLKDVSGVISFDLEMIEYSKSRYINLDDDEYDGIISFLTLLYDVEKYRGISNNIDAFYDSKSIHKSKSSKKYDFGLEQKASKIITSDPFRVDEGILKCIYGMNFTCRFFDLNKQIYRKALEKLGIVEVSDIPFDELDIGDESLFVSGLSLDDEIKYSNLILNGNISLDGVHSDKLMNWLRDNKWSTDNKFYNKIQGLYNYIMYVDSIEMQELQSKQINEFKDKGYRIVFLKSNGCYVEMSVDKYEYPIGSFVCMNTDEGEELLPSVNLLSGYTGEVYSLDYLIENEISFIGSPIRLNLSLKETGLFVDKEQTELESCESFFKFNNASISFEGYGYEEGLFPSGSLEDYMYKLYNDAENGYMIGYLPTIEGLDGVKKSVARRIFNDC